MTEFGKFEFVFVVAFDHTANAAKQGGLSGRVWRKVMEKRKYANNL